jgi:hypothetical protein
MGMSETFPYDMPAKAGIQSRHYGIQTLDPRFRGNDGNRHSWCSQRKTRDISNLAKPLFTE